MKISLSCPAVSVQAVLENPEVPIVDVRTPSEYARDHIWGAINIPLFNDDQRAIIGTLYVQHSPQRAKEAGAEMVRQRICHILEQFFQVVDCSLPEDYGAIFEQTLEEFLQKPPESVVVENFSPPESPPLFVYCWRGGMRSSAIVLLLRRLGIEAYQVAGGYRAFRAFVRTQLTQLELPPLWVLQGLTGVGKTEVLHQVEALAPQSTLDLEGIAQHRSSILGCLHLSPRSQKAFESFLLKRLLEVQSSPFLLTEAESRKIGDVEIPATLFRLMEKAPEILLEAPLELRVKRLVCEYVRQPEETQTFLWEKLPFFRKYLSELVFQDLSRALERQKFEQVAEILIRHYYDPKYRHAIKKRRREVKLRLDVYSVEETAWTILQFLKSKSEKR